MVGNGHNEDAGKNLVASASVARDMTRMTSTDYDGQVRPYVHGFVMHYRELSWTVRLPKSEQTEAGDEAGALEAQVRVLTTSLTGLVSATVSFWVAVMLQRLSCPWDSSF